LQLSAINDLVASALFCLFHYGKIRALPCVSGARRRLENTRQRPLLCVFYRGARQRAHGGFLHVKVPLPCAFSKNTRLTIFAVRHARRTAKKLTYSGLTETAAASPGDGVQHRLPCAGVERHGKQNKKRKKITKGGAHRRLATTASEPPTGHHTAHHRAGVTLPRPPPLVWIRAAAPSPDPRRARMVASPTRDPRR
jgi:hypothetical protein